MNPENAEKAEAAAERALTLARQLHEQLAAFLGEDAPVTAKAYDVRVAIGDVLSWLRTSK